MARNTHNAVALPEDNLPPSVRDRLPVMDKNITEIQDAIKSNLGNRALSVADLPKIRMPAGGALMWSIPTASGVETVRDLDVVIPAWTERRVYFAQEFGKGDAGSPPDCYSEDGTEGIGVPGGDCLTCPLAKFPPRGQSGPRSQPCKSLRALMVLLMADGKTLTGKQVLPYALIITPGSLRPFEQFMSLLSMEGEPFYGAAVRIGLVAAKSGGGFGYSQATLSKLQDLRPAERAWVDEYGKTMLPYLRSMAVDFEDVSGTAEN